MKTCEGRIRYSQEGNSYVIRQNNLSPFLGVGCIIPDLHFSGIHLGSYKQYHTLFCALITPPYSLCCNMISFCQFGPYLSLQTFILKKKSFVVSYFCCSHSLHQLPSYSFPFRFFIYSGVYHFVLRVYH